METPTGYHLKADELLNELVNHGWGKFEVEVISSKDNTVRVELKCGKIFVFFVKKEIDFNRDDIL